MSMTLRELAGLSDAPSSLHDAALVMVDLQNTYTQGTMELVGVAPAIAEAKKLLERARDAGTRVFHIMHSGGPGTPYDVEAPIGQIVSDVAPRAGEPVIVKNYPNAFIGTDLEAELRRRGIENIVLAGFMTHMCISSTARGAFNLGFRPTVVDAATATRDLPSADGGVVRASELHAASLAGLRDLFAVVVNRSDDVPAGVAIAN